MNGSYEAAQIIPNYDQSNIQQFLCRRWLQMNVPNHFICISMFEELGYGTKISYWTLWRLIAEQDKC